MPTRIFDNKSQPLGEYLQNVLSDATAVRIATAFLNSAGLQQVLPPLRDILDREGHISIVHGADFHITDADAMRRLAELNMDCETMTYRVFFDENFLKSGRFHSKIYLVNHDDNSCYAIVGSSNLTHAGLNTNLECNCVIEGAQEETAIKQCSASFSRVERDPSSFEPNGEWISKYERASSIAQETTFKIDDNLQALLHELRRPSQVPMWNANSQDEFAIQALQQLESEHPDQYFSLEEIGAKTWELTLAAGKPYDKDNWGNSIRRVMNTNTVGKNKLRVFERQGGEESRSGRYRLSDIGRSYRK